MFKVVELDVYKNVELTVVGSINGLLEFKSFIAEKIISEKYIDKNTLKLKLTWLIWHYDGKNMWFYFTHRPFSLLKKRIKTVKDDRWFRITGD